MKELYNKCVMLYQQGRYSEAEIVSKEALLIAEKTFGPKHPDVAQSLNNLAGLYDSQGKYAEAEPLYKQALVIYENALGKNHPQVAIVLDNMAGCYQNLGKENEAKKHEDRGRENSFKVIKVPF